MVCPHCLSAHADTDLDSATVRIRDGRVQIKGSCPVTKQFVKWLPQSAPDQPHEIHFGKYRGQTYAEIAVSDPDYLRWLASVTEKDRIRQLCEEALSHAD